MSLLISELSTKLPEQLKPDRRFQSGITGRTTQVLTSQNDRYAPNAVSQITVKIPADKFIDAGTVSFRAVLAFTQGLMLQSSVHNLFRRVQCRIGSEIIFDTDGMNVIQHTLNDVTLDETQARNTFAITSLTGSDEYRQKIYSGVSFMYTPNLSILRGNKILPLHMMGALEFTFFLEQTDTAFQKIDANLVNYGYEISNFELVYDSVSVTPEIEASYQREYNNNNLFYSLQNWRMIPFQNQSAVANLKLENLGQSNRTLVVVPRLASRLLKADVNSFQRTAQSLRFVQVQIGTNLLARYLAVGGGAQLMHELQKAVDFTCTGTINPFNYHCQLPGLTADAEALKSSKFVFMQNLETSRDASPEIQSGVSNVPITVSLEYASQIEPTSYYVFVLSDHLLQCGINDTRIYG